MHEYSIVQTLLEEVERELRARGASAARRVRVRIGELAGIETSLLSTAYETFRQRTRCEHAELEIEPIPARWTCPGCERGFARGEMLRCPLCSLPARLEAGDEIVLDRIEMEVGDV